MLDTSEKCEEVRVRSPFQEAMKRVMDVGLSLLLCPIACPVIGLLALLVKIEDGGPCLYRRRVVSQHGDFDAYKLRTMRVDADLVLERDDDLRSEFEQNFKLRSDPRITRVGKYLRKSSLDELPQLFNVLKGQMSLVGPRMITRPELQRYGQHIPLLLRVKPGITGYWQVNGRQDLSYGERVSMDVFYIRNWSLILDIKILFQTLIAALSGRGAC